MEDEEVGWETDVNWKKSSATTRAVVKYEKQQATKSAIRSVRKWVVGMDTQQERASLIDRCVFGQARPLWLLRTLPLCFPYHIYCACTLGSRDGSEILTSLIRLPD